MNYLIITEFFNILNEEIEKIINKESEIITYDLEIDDISNISEDVYSISLFNNHKTIIYKNIDGKNDEEQQEKFQSFILEYIKFKHPNITLIVTANSKLDERKKITKLLKENFKIIDLLDQKDYFYIDRLKNNLIKNNIQISEFDINLFWNKCIKNYDVAINEMNKLLIMLGENKILAKDLIDKFTPQYVEDEIFELKDSIIKNEYNKSRIMLNDYRLSKKSAMPLITLLANEYRLIYIVKNSSLSYEEIAKKMGLNGTYPLTMAKKNAYNYQSDKLLEYIVTLANLDYQIKSGQIDEFVGLELFILGIEVK